MLYQSIAVIATLISGTAIGASDYQPKFDPSRLKSTQTSAPNEVLVLGTPHLSELPASFTSKSLNLLMTRLEAWKPQITTSSKPVSYRLNSPLNQAIMASILGVPRPRSMLQ